MDILDQMSNVQYNKIPNKKNKTSIMANEGLSMSIPLEEMKSNSQLNMMRKNQYTSFQHLKNTSHFDGGNSNKKVYETQSYKDAYNPIQKQNKQNKLNKCIISCMPSSLGVIISQQNSEDSKNTISYQTFSRRRQSNTNSRNNNNNLIDYNQLQIKIESLQNKNRQLEDKTKQLQKQLQRKQDRMKQLQTKLQNEYYRNSQERKKILQQQSTILQNQIKNIKVTYQNQAKKREQLIHWQYKNKLSVAKLQIDSLKSMINKYQTLIQSGNLVSEEKKKLELKYQKQNMQMKIDKDRFLQQQREIDRKTKELDQKTNQLYKNKRQFDRAMQQQKQMLSQQRQKLKKQQLKVKRQQYEKQQQMQYKYKSKQKSLNQKERKLQIEYHQVSLKKIALLKQKQQMTQFHNKIIAQYKINNQKLLQEKERTYKKQSELLNKLHVVELYGQSLNKFGLNKSKNNIQKYTAPEILNQEKSQKVIEPNQKIQIQPKASSPIKSHKTVQHKKINIGDYLLKLQKTASTRGIYKLKQFYM